MPELPEIETVKLQLAKVLTGRRIVRVEVLAPKMVQGNIKTIEGSEVTGVRRKAKVLIIDLKKNQSMAFHFKMAGQLVLDRDPTSPSASLGASRIVGGHPTEDFVGKLPSKHTRVIFKLDKGVLYFNDQRMFGWVNVNSTYNIDHLPFIEGLGPEPFDIDAESFLHIFEKVKKPIKLALMEQTKISGVGNIYANDACWEAKINPRRLANTLTRKQLQDLFDGMIKVLKEGIKYGGATAADAKYIDLHGLGGHYQEHFRVYDREGEECLRPACRQAGGGIIHKFALGGRGTYMCPKCQE